MKKSDKIFVKIRKFVKNRIKNWAGRLGKMKNLKKFFFAKKILRENFSTKDFFRTRSSGYQFLKRTLRPLQVVDEFYKIKSKDLNTISNILINMNSNRN